MRDDVTMDCTKCRQCPAMEPPCPERVCPERVCRVCHYYNPVEEVCVCWYSECNLKHTKPTDTCQDWMHL